MPLPLETKKLRKESEDMSRDLTNPTPEGAEQAPSSEVHPLRLEQRRQFGVLRKYLPGLKIL